MSSRNLIPKDHKKKILYFPVPQFKNRGFVLRVVFDIVSIVYKISRLLLHYNLTVWKGSRRHACMLHFLLLFYMSWENGFTKAHINTPEIILFSFEYYKRYKKLNVPRLNCTFTKKMHYPRNLFCPKLW